MLERLVLALFLLFLAGVAWIAAWASTPGNESGRGILALTGVIALGAALWSLIVLG